MKNFFDENISSELIQRINNLFSISTPRWGKMSVDQMLAHCNVAFEMVFEDIHPKPSGLKKLFLNLVVKKVVISEIPFKKNS